MDCPYSQLQDDRLDNASWKSHYNFIGIFYMNVLVSCASFSIVLPSIWPYIQKHDGTDEFLAVVLFIYSFGELVGSLAFGYLYNCCSAKFCFLTCVVLGFVGSALYALADFFSGDVSLWLIFTSRVLQGLWTGGQQSAEAAYISEVIKPKHKLIAMSDLGAFSVVGFCVGPVLGYFLSFANFEILGLRIDQSTGPGMLMAVANLVMMPAFMFGFKEVTRKDRFSFTHNTTGDPIPPNSIGVCICLLVALAAFSGFAVQETITTPLVTDSARVYSDSFDWSLPQAYMLYMSSSIASIGAFVFLNKTAGMFDERKLLYNSLIATFIGWLLFIDWIPRQINPGMFFVGYIIVGLGFPIQRCIVVNVLSSIIGGNPAGKYMGWIIATGGVARCLGPFLSIYTLRISPKFCFGLTALLFILAIVALHLGWESCSKHKASPAKPKNKPD